MDCKRIVSQLDEEYTVQENRLEENARNLKAFHGSIMPRTYVGKAYGKSEFHDLKIPRILVFSINQGRQGQKGLSAEEVRQSMRNILRDENGRYRPNGFGPRALAANLCRWILLQCGANEEQISPEDIHNLIAYDNFVKWPFDTKNSEPPKTAWPIFYDINRRIMEILQPEIILCLGKDPYYQLWKAVKDHGYVDESNVPGCAFSLLGPWGRCELGWCYHYSNPRYPKRAWKELQVDGKIPEKATHLLANERIESNDLVQRMREIKKQKPWWKEEYAGAAFTQYNAYQRFVAWHVCQTLTQKWIALPKHNSVRS